MTVPYVVDHYSQSSGSLRLPTSPLRLTRSAVVPLPTKGGPSRLPQQLSSNNEFVTEEGPFRFELNSRPNDFGQPEYSNGGVIKGFLEVSKAPGLLGIELRVTGKITVHELGGGDTSNLVMFSHIMFEWSADTNLRLPNTIPLNYTLPSKYIDEDTGLSHMLPPSYKDRVNGIPGFKVRVNYEIKATFTHCRQKAWLWRKYTRMTIPFSYNPQTFPQCRPAQQQLRTTPSNPQLQTQKVFAFSLSPRYPDERPIETRLYLPFGQLCLLDEPISFVIKIFAGDEVLDDFAAATPASNPKNGYSSFHPLPQERSRFTNHSMMSRPGRSPQSLFRIKVELRRTTAIDMRPNGHSALELNTHMCGNTTLNEGPIQSMTRGSGWIAWSGQIIIPHEITTSGFSASHLSVNDEIVLSIRPTVPAKSVFTAFCESIPVRLTRKSHPPPLPPPKSDIYSNPAGRSTFSFSSSSSCSDFESSSLYSSKSLFFSY